MRFKLAQSLATPYLPIHRPSTYMFECRSCALRCMRAVAGDAVSMRQPLQQRLLLTPHLQQGFARRAASTSTARASNSRHASDEVLDDPIEFDDNHGVSAHVSEVQTTQLLSKRSKGVDLENKKSLEMELRYLKDPLKLSEHVKYTLRREKFEKALDLCRLASKTMSCVVSWNAVIDYLMKKHKVNEALKVYNEMKKRAQFPDAYTYMMVLRGLSYKKQGTHNVPVKHENVSKAISIYNSMNEPTSRVKPNIFHTNATLNVCALALDMDALWSVADQIPPKGPNAPDRMTYTIIINAICHAACADNPAGMSREQMAAKRQKAVDEGRRVWMDVIRKWRPGEVTIDEDLVASMGRLLLCSKRIEDWDNVLDLVQQTMNIERLIAPVGSPDRHTDHVPQEEIPEAPKAEEEEADEEGYTNTSATKAFKAVKPTQPEHATSKGVRPLVWAKPGPQILSLLVDACQKMRIPRVATAYWDLLTSGQNSVEPDLENFDRQLRLFALNRASAKAAKLVSEEMQAAGTEPKNSTFRLAMSACKRDMKNPHVLEHATTIIDAMERGVADPDSHVLMEYLSLALTTNDGPKIVAVINRMNPILHNLRSRISYGPDHKMSEEADVRALKGACQFLQTLVGVIDTLMARSLVPRTDFRHWHSRRADLSKFLTSALKRVERREQALQAPPEDDEEVSRPRGGFVGKDVSALRKFRNKQHNSVTQEIRRVEGEKKFNPTRERDGGVNRGFGMWV